LWREKAREVFPPQILSAQAPKFFQGGVLTIGIKNATIGGEISVKTPLFIQWINQKLKKEVVKKIVFRVV